MPAARQLRVGRNATIFSRPSTEFRPSFSGVFAGDGDASAAPLHVDVGALVVHLGRGRLGRVFEAGAFVQPHGRRQLAVRFQVEQRAGTGLEGGDGALDQAPADAQ